MYKELCLNKINTNLKKKNNYCRVSNKCNYRLCTVYCTVNEMMKITLNDVEWVATAIPSSYGYTK